MSGLPGRASAGRRAIALVMWAGALLAGCAGGAGGTSTTQAPTTPTTALGAPHYVDDTLQSGVAMSYDGGPTFMTGGGLAVLDCNGDGRPDLYLAGGAGPAALYRNDSPTGGALRFTRLPGAATDIAGVEGAYPLDLDGDGNADLAVLTTGGAILLRGHGDCTFERANEALGFDGGTGWTSAFSATWEGSTARLPTLAVGSYLKLDASGAPTQDCADDSLVRPNSSGTGYAAPIPLRPGYCTLAMLFSDWSRTGHADLRVANDRQYYVDGEDQLWKIAPGRAPVEYTAGDGWVSMQIWGMGIASQDVTGDGIPEIYLTSQGDNKLQTLALGPTQPQYRDIALKRGVIAAQPFTGGDVLPSTSWHPEFEDVNNDGFMDLFVSKGNVSAMPDYASKDPSELLLGQPSGVFTQGADAAGIVTFDRGRGAALADFNNDGLLDLVESSYGAPARLWRNAGAGGATASKPMGNWLALTLSQDGPNRNAVGAWLEVQVGDMLIRHEVTVGGGHLSGQLGPVHVGIGPSATARVRVLWPDGSAGGWQQVPANQFTVIPKGGAPVSTAQPAGH